MKKYIFTMALGVALGLNAGAANPSPEPASDPGETDFYIIGSNVNGYYWELEEPSCKFESLGGGVYVWQGDVLGTGFKINDGTWNNNDYNIGSTGASLEIGSPYYYTTGGSSGNINLANCTEVINPVVTLDINQMSILVEGYNAGEYEWYIMGINDYWDFDNNEYKLLPVEDLNGVYASTIYVYETSGEFKIAMTGWAKELGSYDDWVLSLEHPMISLMEVVPSIGNIQYDLPEGQYRVTFDAKNYYVIFEPVGFYFRTTYYIMDSTGYMYKMSAQGNETYIYDGSFSLKDGVAIVKETRYSDGNYQYTFYSAENESYLALNESVRLMEYPEDSFNVTPFVGFDLLYNGILTFDPGKNILCLQSGETFVKGVYDADFPEKLYILGPDVDGLSVSEPNEDFVLTTSGDGTYTWEGVRLGNGFKIMDADNTPRFTIGSSGDFINPDMATYFNAGKKVKGINFGGYDYVVDPKINLDLNTWTITVYQNKAAADLTEAEDAGKVEYFDLQGVKVENPQKGQIYIRVANGVSSKIVKTDRN